MVQRKLWCLFILFFNVSVFADCCLVTNTTRSKFSFFWPQGPVKRKSTEDVIKSAGYPVETHTVKTEDGYELTMHRIPRGKGQAYLNDCDRSNNPRPPVLLHHGMLCSSAAWVVSGERDGLGFILADEGYDVWLLNARGNTYSRKHEYLDYKADAPQFWNFSFHEIGYYDLPAEIDYILDVTLQSQVYYIGFSMGTTAYYVMASTRSEYNKKVKMMFSLAPIAYMGHQKSTFVNMLIMAEPVITPILEALNVYDILPQNRPCDLLNKYVCSHPRYYRICEFFIETLSGYDHDQYNYEVVSAFLEHFPAGTSWKVFQHYFQLIKGKRFQQYDYGWVDNRRHYGTVEAPDYPLKNIITHMALLKGENDFLSVIDDVQNLETQLQYITVARNVKYKKFSHADFMWAKDVRKLVHDVVVEVLYRFVHPSERKMFETVDKNNNTII